ncbi:MAG: PfkB family carbohydrate kinase [Acetobacteraceae bacterium]
MWLAEKVRFSKHEQTTSQSPRGRGCAAYRAFIREEADIVFANEAEICALYETEDFDAAVEAVRAEVAIAALTRSEKGSRIIAGTETHEVHGEPTKLVDSIGAGDAYAAGFMAALAVAWLWPSAAVGAALPRPR